VFNSLGFSGKGAVVVAASIFKLLKSIKMTAKIKSQPENFLDENFDADSLHPADIEQIIVSAFDEYQNIPKFTKLKRQYRDAYNRLVDCLAEKRNFTQFSHL
jgi:Txe/YoeB family toxin of Txe-Axe toxin-antitoxin module